MLRAVKNKLPKGTYVLMLTQYDSVGGRPLSWSRIGSNGIGNMRPGITRMCRHEGRYFDIAVAVKVPAELDRFTNLVLQSKLSRLPGVTRLFGRCEADPRCIVYERADGSLHDVLYKRKPMIDLSMPMKLSLAVQVSAAMECINNLGLQHCNLKASNILIFQSSEGSVVAKVTDFGFPNMVDEQHNLNYCPPEYFDSKRKNIFALVLFYILIIIFILFFFLYY
mgnify:CR=1 FL=1